MSDGRDQLRVLAAVILAPRAPRALDEVSSRHRVRLLPAGAVAVVLLRLLVPHELIVAILDVVQVLRPAQPFVVVAGDVAQFTMVV